MTRIGLGARLGLGRAVPFRKPRILRPAAAAWSLLAALWLLAPVPAAVAEPGEERVLVCFGDSLTAAYGLDPAEGYPARIQEMLTAEGGGWKVAAAGQSGETSAGGVRRVDWILRRRVDVFFLALGANDGLRGLPTAQLESNLLAILGKVRQRHPRAQLVLAGLRLPGNLGEDYGREFAGVFSRVAAATGAERVPFLLEGVAGRPELNLPDGIHPNAAGQRAVAAHIWPWIQRAVRAVENRPEGVRP